MEDHRSDTVLRFLDRSIELFSQLRTPDPVSAAAYDTLKQARAMIARSLTLDRRFVDAISPDERVAAASGFPA